MPIQILPNEPRPSRRAVLAGLAAGGASLVFGAGSRAQLDHGTNWYALVSDTHVAANLSTRTRGEVMADNLRAVVAEILAAESRPLGVVIDGDLALTDGQAGDYRTLVTLLEPIRKARVPIHLALGNHDDRDRFRAVLGEMLPADSKVSDKQVAVVDGPGVRLVILDSLDRVNVTPGRLGPTQLEWLAGTLDAGLKTMTPTMVFVHHNLAPGKSALTDTDALLAVLRPRARVKAVFFGHTHVWNVGSDSEAERLHLVNLPAVAYTFGPGQPLGWCRFQPGTDSGTLELRCVGGDRASDRQRVGLRWRV